MGLTAPTASGDPAAARSRPAPPVAGRWRRSLILVLTRRCDLRCAYCPTVKDGEPDLSPEDVRRALELFVARWGGGEAKLFGGEPLLHPAAVRAAFTHAPPSVTLWLSTNGTHLDEATLALVRARPGTVLTLSLDGPAEVHDPVRRGPGSSHATALGWLPRLNTLPGFVVTQTIAPHTAARAAESFRWLRAQGVRRFNLLPGYHLRWSAAQLAQLSSAFEEIEEEIRGAWARGERLYLRNLFVWAPTPFYNTGMVVDVDRRIYASNLILARRFDELRELDALGTLDDPPDTPTLEAGAAKAAAQLRDTLPAEVAASTAAVDQLLTRLCDRLLPEYLAHRARRAA